MKDGRTSLGWASIGGKGIARESIGSSSQRFESVIGLSRCGRPRAGKVEFFTPRLTALSIRLSAS